VMTIQDVFYLTGSLFFTLTLVFYLWLIYLITKFSNYIREQKMYGQEIVTTALQAKYGIKVSILRLILKFLRGGDKYDK